MLGDLDLCHGQLLDLPAHRLAHPQALAGREDVPAATVLGPILDDVIHGPRRQQWPALALMAELGTLFATRWILATLRCAGRQIGARGNRRITRAAVQPALELGDPLILASDMRLQLLIRRSIRKRTSTTTSRPAS